MAAIHLTVSERISDAETSSLVDALRAHFEIDGPHHYFRKAESVPQFIQLLADWKVWVGLGLLASGFLTKIGQRAGDALWDSIRERLKRKDAKPLADTAAALARARKAAGASGYICIGLAVPDDYFGTVVVIHDTEPEKIAYQIARFAEKAEAIAAAMREEISAGNGPTSRVTVTLLDDGGVKLEWHAQSGFKPRERHLY